MAYVSGEDAIGPKERRLDNMQEVMAQKAVELFQLCDTEKKGYITKLDMQRLKSELPVSSDQLQIVFDSLDHDGNGSLTVDEFTNGFGNFLGLGANSSLDDPLDQDFNEESALFQGEAGVLDQEVEDKMFREMIRQNGATGIFQDEEIIKAMWQKLHREEPDIVTVLEEFLARLAGDIKKSKVDFLSLESALHSKTNEHEEEVKKLYEEMELQIKQEREKILAEERAKEKLIKGTLEEHLKDKEKQFQDLLARQQELEHQLDEQNRTDSLTKQENERLQKEKEQLEELLSQSQESLEESKTYIQQMQLQQKDEKRERARSALMLSEGIAIERESLVKQLDMLRDVNKKLRDDKDEAEATDLRRVQQVKDIQKRPKPHSRKELSKQGSVLSNYFPGGGSTRKMSTFSVDLDPCHLDGDVDDEHFDEESMKEATVFLADENDDTVGALSNEPNLMKHRNFHRQHHFSSGEENGLEEDSSGEGGKEKKMRGKIFMPKTARSQPVGADAQNISGDVLLKPQRIFKIVFVGDSCVGKSTYIHRICHQEFRPNFTATIGIDFQVKTIDTKDTTVILQLWDTAGQERFRSMTKTYFRKADGVIVVYDVTFENSFKSVRNWMRSVLEEVEDGTVMMLLGNKYDMAEDDSQRPVKEKDGLALATESEMLFFETSAKTDYHVQESIETFVSLLQEKEDKKLEEGLKLSAIKQKRKCCNR